MGLIGLGVVLLILGFLLGLNILWVIGIVCLIAGVVLLVVHEAPGPRYRRWY